MVFVSLEGFVGSAPHSQQQQRYQHQYRLPISRMHELATSMDASVHVVVTPGSPAKKHANASLMLTRSRFGFRSSKAAAATTSASTTFLLYVTDSAATSKWVLTKSATEYHELRTLTQQAIGACQKFSCCGPLRRIAKSPLYKSARKKWSDSSVVSQYGLAGVIQEYINDLLLAVFAREQQCESTTSARVVLTQFLDIASHRAVAADAVMRSHSSTTSTTPTGLTVRAHECSARHPCRTRNGSDPVTSSHADSECPICCADLGSDTTLELACSHVFHAACVRVWFTMQHTCPVCRAVLTTASPPA